jgi:hypothetical protein
MPSAGRRSGRPRRSAASSPHRWQWQSRQVRRQWHGRGAARWDRKQHGGDGRSISSDLDDCGGRSQPGWKRLTDRMRIVGQHQCRMHGQQCRRADRPATPACRRRSATTRMRRPDGERQRLRLAPGRQQSEKKPMRLAIGRSTKRDQCIGVPPSKAPGDTASCRTSSGRRSGRAPSRAASCRHCRSRHSRSQGAA